MRAPPQRAPALPARLGLLALLELPGVRLALAAPAALVLRRLGRPAAGHLDTVMAWALWVGALWLAFGVGLFWHVLDALGYALGWTIGQGQLDRLRREDAMRSLREQSLMHFHGPRSTGLAQYATRVSPAPWPGGTWRWNRSWELMGSQLDRLEPPRW